MKCIGLRFNTVKILGIHFSYNKKNENDEKFLEQITSIEKVLKLWHMQNLTLDGQVSFQSISNIQDSSSSVNIPASTMKELNKIQKEFI